MPDPRACFTCVSLATHLQSTHLLLSSRFPRIPLTLPSRLPRDRDSLSLVRTTVSLAGWSLPSCLQTASASVASASRCCTAKAKIQIQPQKLSMRHFCSLGIGTVRGTDAVVPSLESISSQCFWIVPLGRFSSSASLRLSSSRLPFLSSSAPSSGSQDSICHQTAEVSRACAGRGAP